MRPQVSRGLDSVVRTAGGGQAVSDRFALRPHHHPAQTAPSSSPPAIWSPPDAASVPDVLGKPSPGTGRLLCHDTVARWPSSGSAAPAGGLAECAPGTPRPPFSCPWRAWSLTASGAFARTLSGEMLRRALRPTAPSTDCPSSETPSDTLGEQKKSKGRYRILSALLTASLWTAIS